jgi:hypothetical protein
VGEGQSQALLWKISLGLSRDQDENQKQDCLTLAFEILKNISICQVERFSFQSSSRLLLFQAVES